MTPSLQTSHLLKPFSQALLVQIYASYTGRRGCIPTLSFPHASGIHPDDHIRTLFCLCLLSPYSVRFKFSQPGSLYISILIYSNFKLYCHIFSLKIEVFKICFISLNGYFVFIPSLHCWLKVYSLPFAPILTLNSLSIYVHVHVFS